MTTYTAPSASISLRARLENFSSSVLWLFIALSFFYCLSLYRLLPNLFLLACVILWLKDRKVRRDHYAALFLSVFLAMQFWLPVDISLLYRPGQPRIFPLVMGLPTEVTARQGRRGEVVLGGCIVRGNEPRWILVW